ncbi:MAG: 30S ribosomal protein S20 [Patescibacteria group bacterium]|jgi:small subunit ribosomal protein S20
MAHKAAAFKAIRQTIKLTARNRNRRRTVKELTGVSLKAIETKAQTAVEQVRVACKAIDKAVQKGSLHRNTGARKKARLVKRLNSILKP